MRPGTRWKRRTRAERRARVKWIGFGPVPRGLSKSKLYRVFRREYDRRIVAMWTATISRPILAPSNHLWDIPPGDFGIIQTKPQPTHWLDRT